MQQPLTIKWTDTKGGHVRRTEDAKVITRILIRLLNTECPAVVRFDNGERAGGVEIDPETSLWTYWLAE
jgi:hypothetical protein